MLNKYWIAFFSYLKGNFSQKNRIEKESVVVKHSKKYVKIENINGFLQFKNKLGAALLVIFWKPPEIRKGT